MNERIRNCLEHAGLGLLIGFIVAVTTQSIFVGWLGQGLFWLGVEAEQHRRRLIIAGTPITWRTFYRLFYFHKWTLDSRWDFAAPVVGNGIIALLAAALMR